MLKGGIIRHRILDETLKFRVTPDEIALQQGLYGFVMDAMVSSCAHDPGQFLVRD
jgi:hypothetical protein